MRQLYDLRAAVRSGPSSVPMWRIAEGLSTAATTAVAASLAARSLR